MGHDEGYHHVTETSVVRMKFGDRRRVARRYCMPKFCVESWLLNDAPAGVDTITACFMGTLRVKDKAKDKLKLGRRSHYNGNMLRVVTAVHKRMMARELQGFMGD
eukprot:TRINITY_DN68191_c5_g4_i1.p1 TRINITY_DN68191_c5_g4~~TRINITY_DN68191_c5_g4_i1.p1  ORF type:complete len:105 (-),score=9.22 TRINITY_DN68191_c5_g4_i1:243-557(-)